MQVCLAVPYFPPELGAASLRAEALVAAMLEAGHKVVVVTPKPSYFLEKSGSAEQSLNSTKKSIKDAGDVHVITSPFSLRPKREGSISRIVSEILASIVSFPVLLKVARRSDLVFASSPPVMYALAASIAGRIDRTKVVVEVRDLWPDVVLSTLYAERSPTAATKALGWIGKYLTAALYWLASCIVVVTRSDFERLSYLSASEKTVYLFPNGADEEAISIGKRRSRPKSQTRTTSCRPFKIAYAGRLGPAQKVSTLIEAAASTSIPLEITIVGSGPERDKIARLASNLEKHAVHILGPISRKKVLQLLAEQDAVYVPLASKSVASSVPSKLFEAWALGLPVLLAASGEAAKIVEEVGGGLIADPDSSSSIAKAIETLASDPQATLRMSANGQKAVLERYRRSKLMADLVHVITEPKHKVDVRAP